MTEQPQMNEGLQKNVSEALHDIEKLRNLQIVLIEQQKNDVADSLEFSKYNSRVAFYCFCTAAFFFFFACFKVYHQDIPSAVVLAIFALIFSVLHNTYITASTSLLIIANNTKNHIGK